MPLLCSTSELRLDHTLMSGQAFRWQRSGDTWICALTGPDLPLILTTAADCVHCALPAHIEAARVYFRLDIDASVLQSAFAAADPQIAPAIQEFQGLRILRQDPVECLFAFLCTSAAPLHRIRTGIGRMCHAYGEHLEHDGAHYTRFPEVERLAVARVDELYGMGLGYRARYIRQAAEEVTLRGGRDWLLSLREASYADAKKELLPLTGVGEKIADCVLLFSLDKDEAVPVDTHIRQVASRYPEAASPKATYSQIAGAIRERFGAYAGWAQQFLFFGDLYQRGAWNAYVRQYERA